MKVFGRILGILLLVVFLAGTMVSHLETVVESYSGSTTIEKVFADRTLKQVLSIDGKTTRTYDDLLRSVQLSTGEISAKSERIVNSQAFSEMVCEITKEVVRYGKRTVSFKPTSAELTALSDVAVAALEKEGIALEDGQRTALQKNLADNYVASQLQIVDRLESYYNSWFIFKLNMVNALNVVKIAAILACVILTLLIALCFGSLGQAELWCGLLTILSSVPFILWGFNVWTDVMLKVPEGFLLIWATLIHGMTKVPLAIDGIAGALIGLILFFNGIGRLRREHTSRQAKETLHPQEPYPAEAAPAPQPAESAEAPAGPAEPSAPEDAADAGESDSRPE